jgi:circadian clock protein KaiC
MMIAESKSQTIEKVQTKIEGLDGISNGGLPRNRTTLVAGTAGCGKTVLATQFLAEGIAHSSGNGVFVTFEETPGDICKNMMGFGWDIQAWEAENKWAFVDASPPPGEEVVESGSYDFGALLARIEHAVRKVDAKRLSMDSLGAVFSRFTDSAVVRSELFRLAATVKKMGVTAILTAERTEEYGSISRFGVEEFVADNVIILRNALEEETRRRTIEILKLRGTSHQSGEYPFTIVPDEGVVIIPLSSMELKQSSSNVRITSGSDALDAMCGGGFFRDSVILVSGATGTGKTLMVTGFLGAGAGSGERCLLFAFEESREQLFRNATGWGIDFAKMEKDGKLKVICEYPESAGLEDHLIRMKKQMAEFQPTRVAVDSLSALERVSTIKGFREFVIGITSFIKHQEIAGLFTATTASLLGGTSITETHISTITDSIILLRYVELFGEMHRGMTVLKMRGSMHDKDIREFRIDGEGMHIGRPFRNVSGILSGAPTHVTTDEIQRIDSMFQEEATPVR